MSDANRYRGVVVDRESPGGDPSGGGLYLRTDDGQELELIHAHPFVQMPVSVAHDQSRVNFEPFLGRTVVIQGHRQGRAIWSASVVGPEE